MWKHPEGQSNLKVKHCLSHTWLRPAFVVMFHEIFMTSMAQRARNTETAFGFVKSTSKVESQRKTAGVQAIWEAALAGSSRDLLLALHKGGSLEYRGPCGKTPLLCAASAGHPNVVQLLMEQV